MDDNRYMIKTLALLLVFSISSSFASGDGDVIYLGGTNSTKSQFGDRLDAFLRDPIKQCKNAIYGEKRVLTLTGEGIGPKHWTESEEASRKFFYDRLKQKGFLRVSHTGDSPLEQLVLERGVRERRKLILEFGDESLAHPMYEGYEYKLMRMITRMGIKPNNCIIVAPQPNVKPELAKGKAEILKAIKVINEIGLCQVVSYDEEKSGKLPLGPDGAQLTSEGYDKWASSAIKGICDTKIFSMQNLIRNGKTEKDSDSVLACINCLEGMPFPGQLPFEPVLNFLSR